MSNISISAVIPAYNASKYIQSALDSLLNQTLPLSEIIVVDDGSTDDTAAIVSYLSQDFPIIKLIQLQSNLGIANARNTGIDVANGEFVLFMDADDIVLPSLLYDEYENLRQMESIMQSELALCHSAYAYINELGNEIGDVVRWKQLFPEETLGYQFVRNNIITSSGVLIKREILLEMGRFNSAIKCSEDYELWLRIASKYGFAYIDKPLVKVRRHANNSSKSLARMLKAEQEILKRYTIEEMEKAIEKRHLPWWENKVDYIGLLYKLEYWEKGYEIAQMLLTLKPTYDKIFFLLGLYYLHERNLNEALTCFKQVIQINPNHGAALNNAGAILAIKGEVEEAEKMIRKAIALYPGYLDANHNLKEINTKDEFYLQTMRFTWRELRPVLMRYSE